MRRLLRALSFFRQRRAAAAVLDDDFSVEAVRHRIWPLAGPTLAELMLTNLTQMINLMLVGHLGAAAVAAVGSKSLSVVLA